MKNKVNYPAIITFYAIAVALRYLTNKTTILDIIPNEILRKVLTGSGPAIGALVVFILFRIKPVLSLKGNYNKLIVPFAIFWLFPIALVCGIEYFTKQSMSYVAMSAILMYGLLEEIGWRGFLQQELKSLPKFLNILIVATLWFLWHLNFELSGSNLLFFGIIVLGTWGIGKVADTTESLLAVAAFHSLNNMFSDLNTVKITVLVILISVWVMSMVIRKKYFRPALI